MCWRSISFDTIEERRSWNVVSPLTGPSTDTGPAVRGDPRSFARTVFDDEGDFPRLPSTIEARGGKLLPQTTTAHGAISGFAMPEMNSGHRDAEAANNLSGG
jgi:hypothetical protein